VANVSIPPLHKRAGNWLLNTYETSAITFNGAPLAITFNRGWTATQSTSFTIRNILTSEVLATKMWTGGLGSAIVINDTIHLFGSTDWGSNGNAVIHSVLDAGFNPSTPSVILQANSSYRIFNTDICATPCGFTMTYETNSGIYFLTSTDGNSFSPVLNASIHQGQYCACPSVARIDGWYYLTYLSYLDNKYVTQVSRSKDLITWQDFTGNTTYPSYICLLAPDGPGEGINASDVSMTEYNGCVYGVYMDGDQSTWAHLRTFIYFGTLEQLYKEFFPNQ
jgi:hypothetical protein